MADNADAVNTPVVADTTPTGSAPVENESSEVTDGELESFDEGFNLEETDGDDKPAKADEPVVAEETESEPQPQQEDEKPLSPKSENRFQQLANKNRELTEQIEQLKAREAQFAQEQGLLNEVNPETGDYYTPQEVERIAFQQSREAQQQSIAEQRYNLEVQQNQQMIDEQAGRALQEFPMFNSESPEYNAELAAEAAQILSSALIYDNNGVLVGSSIQPYQLYKTIHDSSRINDAKHQAIAQRSTEKMLANADVLGGAPQTQTKKDAFMEAFDSEF